MRLKVRNSRITRERKKCRAFLLERQLVPSLYRDGAAVYWMATGPPTPIPAPNSWSPG